MKALILFFVTVNFPALYYTKFDPIWMNMIWLVILLIRCLTFMRYLAYLDEYDLINTINFVIKLDIIHINCFPS